VDEQVKSPLLCQRRLARYCREFIQHAGKGWDKIQDLHMDVPNDLNSLVAVFQNGAPHLFGMAKIWSKGTVFLSFFVKFHQHQVAGMLAFSIVKILRWRL
jgi:hypothetical protein